MNEFTEGGSKHLTVTVYGANQCGNAKNCLYPNVGTGSAPEELKRLFANDHTLIRFKKNYRCIDNFEEATVAGTDVDNDHSENPADWVAVDDMPKLFPGVPIIIYTSRSHMKQKGSRSPRPRFHAIFPIAPITDPAAYTQLMKRLQAAFPFFDGNALDAGRFFFGNPDTQVFTFPGNRTLTDFLEEKEQDAFAQMERTIPEGSRNSTLSHAAGKILKRWGDTKEAGRKFLEEAEKCSPPLDRAELQQIWNSALKFYRGKVTKQPDYIPPADYNAPAEPKWEPPIPFTQHTLPEFPVDAFPPAIRDYVLAVAETTQTPVDMAATAALAVLALCQQGKYRIKGKDDWIEPLNLFTVIVAEPSERKSAVISHTSRYGNEWTRSSISRILQNYSYTGNLLLQTTYRKDHLTKRKQQNNGELPKYHITDVHEAIIPLWQFNAAQEEMQRRAEKHTPKFTPKYTYPLAGKIVCAKCGKIYRRKVKETGPVWICPTYNIQGKAACSSKAIPEPVLETIADEVGGIGKITALQACDDNTVVLTLCSGEQIVKRWQDRSRRQSWTPEMREVARQRRLRKEVASC